MGTSNDTKPIQTNNLAVTPQLMTAGLFFGVSLRAIAIGDCYSHNQNLRAIAIGDHYAPATDDRCTNFSASTCPEQPPQLTASSTADKLPLEKFHRLLDLAFWG